LTPPDEGNNAGSDVEPFPLEGRPWFDAERWWVSPLNFDDPVQDGLPERVRIHDVTLRDGEQTPGVVYRPDERVAIAKALDGLGVDRIEVGMPIVSEEVARGCAEVAALGLNSEIVGFARAHPDDIDLCSSCGLSSVIVEHAVNPYLCRWVYDLDRAQLLDRLDVCFRRARELGLEPIFMGWDFSRCTLDYLLELYSDIVQRCRPEGLVLVDTFGVATPAAVQHAVGAFKSRFGSLPLEFHNHDDFGLAVGAAVAAVQGGASVLHTSMNGLGERAGNAPTEQVLAALKMLLGVETGARLDRLTAVSRLVEQITKVPLPANAPIVGRRIFQIETGVAVHSSRRLRAAGIMPTRTFVPGTVGQPDVKVLVGAGSGTASIRFALEDMNLDLAESQVHELVAEVKREATIRKGLIDDESLRAIVERIAQQDGRATAPAGDGARPE
jgi:methanogen homocitrate synthase